MTETTHLALPYIDAAQAQKHVTHNEALQLLDSMTQLSVIDRRASPPASPEEGDRHLVVATAAGGFAGKEQMIAARHAGAWAFLAPKAGWRAYVESEEALLLFDGSSWIDAGLALRELANLSRLGVGATADAVDRLAVKTNAALLAALTVAEGGAGDMRFKLEKESAGNTVSQLYQSNWSGRAETGLVGDDNFHIKVSADGTIWREALIVDRTSGRVAFPSGMGDGAPVGFRNRLRNAAFAINQRGVAGTVTLAAGQYGHDGVKAGAAGATYTFSSSGIDTSLSISTGSLILPIEAALIEGGAFALAHEGTSQARVWQGTGFAGSGAYAAASRGAPLLASGLTANAQTNVEFSGGSILRPQFEPGAHASDFERRPSGVELALCQRYFTTLSVGWAGVATAIYQFAGGYIPFPVHMRATPTASAPTSGVGYNVVDEFVDLISQSGFRYLIRAAGEGSFTSANSIVTFSAEI